jgi:hypothetical protein
MIGGTKPGLDLNYNFDDLKLRFRNLGVLWNIHELLISSAKLAGIKSLSDPASQIRYRRKIHALKAQLHNSGDNRAI